MFFVYHRSNRATVDFVDLLRSVRQKNTYSKNTKKDFTQLIGAICLRCFPTFRTPNSKVKNKAVIFNVSFLQS